MEIGPLKSAEEMLKSIPQGMLVPDSGIEYRSEGYVKPYEICLNHNHEKLIKLIDSFDLNYYPKRKWQIITEFRLRLITSSLNLEKESNLAFEEFLNSSVSIIAMPSSKGYPTFLAEHIIHLDDYQIQFFLDYQLLEYERTFDTKFEFYALIEHWITLMLLKSYPIKFNQKVSYIVEWLNKEYESLDKAAYNSYRYYSFEKEKEIRESIGNENNDQYTNKQKIKHQQITPYCEARHIENYFNLLKRKNPKNNKPYMDTSGINWIIQNFGVPKNIKKKPDFALNISRNILMVFFHKFFVNLDRRPQKTNGKSLNEYADFLMNHFSDLFDGQKRSSVRSSFNYYKNYLANDNKPLSFPEELNYIPDKIDLVQTLDRQ